MAKLVYRILLVIVSTEGGSGRRRCSGAHNFGLFGTKKRRGYKFGIWRLCRGTDEIDHQNGLYTCVLGGDKVVGSAGQPNWASYKIFLIGRSMTRQGASQGEKRQMKRSCYKWRYTARMIFSGIPPEGDPATPALWFVAANGGCGTVPNQNPLPGTHSHHLN